MRILVFVSLIVFLACLVSLPMLADWLITNGLMIYAVGIIFVVYLGASWFLSGLISKRLDKWKE